MHRWAARAAASLFDSARRTVARPHAPVIASNQIHLVRHSRGPVILRIDCKISHILITSTQTNRKLKAMGTS